MPCRRSMHRPHAIPEHGRRRLPAKRALALALTFLATGCTQEMAQQPAYRPLRASSFFADRQATRPQVAGTIARGQLTDDGPRFPTYTLGNLYAAQLMEAA